jgi:8-oxo-dGTP pyrophosphatase MutT (NUDIX family)
MADDSPQPQLPGPIRLATVRERLALRPALAIDVTTRSQAAVAILLAECEGDTHALLIKRADREGDPWSGQMAFPGGRREPHELDLYATAARETFEEVGVDLLSQAEQIGRLDDIRAQSDRPIDMLIRPYVCASPCQPDLRPNHREVCDTVWVPLSTLAGKRADGLYPYNGASFPAFVYSGFTIWGLTYRMLASLIAALD